MTVDMLTGAAGIVLSLFFSYVPRVKDWYQTKDDDTKRLVMLFWVALTAIGMYFLSCTDLPVQAFVTCNRSGALELLRLFFLAAVANQTAYKFTPRPEKKD